MGDDPTDRIVSMVLAFIIGIIMVASVAIPIAISQINSIKLIPDISESDLTMYTSLLGVAILMVIIGLVYGVVRYMRSDR